MEVGCATLYFIGVINPGEPSRFRRCPNGRVGKDADCRAAATAFRVAILLLGSLLAFTNPDRVRRMGASATVVAVTVWIGVQVPLPSPSSFSQRGSSHCSARPSHHRQSPSPCHFIPVPRFAMCEARDKRFRCWTGASGLEVWSGSSAGRVVRVSALCWPPSAVSSASSRFSASSPSAVSSWSSSFQPLHVFSGTSQPQL
jgi:hypothetical protein